MKFFAIERPSLLAYGLVGLFVFCLACALFMPMHPDDPLYAYRSIRAGFDGWTFSFNNSYYTEIPISLFPGRWVSWVQYKFIGDPIATRLSNALILGAWLAVLAWILKQHFSNAHFFFLFACLLSYVGLGKQLLAHLVNRPETSMLLCIGAAIALPYYVRLSARSWIKQVILFILFFVGLSYFTSAHPKSLFFIPMILSVAACMFFHHKKLAVACALLTILLSFDAYYFWETKLLHSRINAPVHPVDNGFPYLFPGMFWANPSVFLSRFLANIGNIGEYFDTMQFYSSYNIAVKNFLLLPWLYPFIRDFIAFMLWAAIVTGAIGYGVAGMGSIRSRRWPQVPFLLATGLIVGLILHSGLQNQRTTYDAIMIIGELVMINVLLAPYWIGLLKKLSCRNSLLMLCCLFGALSMMVFGISNAKWRVRAYTMLESTHDHARWPFIYQQNKEGVEELLEMCHIPVVPPAKYLILDTATYPVLRETYRPFFLGGVPYGKRYAGKKLTYDLIRHPDIRFSDGMVMTCKSFPPGIRRATHKKGNLCCVGEKRFKRWRKKMKLRQKKQQYIKRKNER